jgi:transposase-like protein
MTKDTNSKVAAKLARGRGRPSILTPELIERIKLAYLQPDASLRTVAKAFNMSATTVVRALRGHR